MAVLKHKLSQLYLPGKKDDLKSSAVDVSQPSDVTRRLPPLQLPRSQLHSCVLMSKPIEKLCVRYEHVPRDYSQPLSASLVSHDAGGMVSQRAANRLSTGALMTLGRYLHHQRWVWSVQQRGCQLPISMQAIARLLSTITKSVTPVCVCY